MVGRGGKKREEKEGQSERVSKREKEKGQRRSRLSFFFSLSLPLSLFVRRLFFFLIPASLFFSRLSFHASIIIHSPDRRDETAGERVVGEAQQEARLADAF